MPEINWHQKSSALQEALDSIKSNEDMTIDWDAMNEACKNDFKLDFTCNDCKKVLNSQYLKFVGNGKGIFRVGYYMDGLVRSVIEDNENGGDLFCLCNACEGKSECTESMW